MTDPAKPRSPNRRGEGDRLAGELVAAAERLLVDTGSAAAVSLRAIAREAGVSAPSAYLHFPNKDAIVQAAVDRRFAQLAARISAAADAEGDPAAGLRAGCLAYCGFALAEPGGYRVLFEAELPEGRDPASGLAAFLTLVDGVQGAIAAGRCPPQDPFRTSTLVWCALHGLVALRGARPGFPWDDLDVLVDDLLARLVGVPPAGAA